MTLAKAPPTFARGGATFPQARATLTRANVNPRGPTFARANVRPARVNVRPALRRFESQLEAWANVALRGQRCPAPGQRWQKSIHTVCFEVYQLPCHLSAFPSFLLSFFILSEHHSSGFCGIQEGIFDSFQALRTCHLSPKGTCADDSQLKGAVRPSASRDKDYWLGKRRGK